MAATLTTIPDHESSNKVPEVEIEVEIMDLKDVYNKKTKKTLEGLQYPLEDSKVTIMVQASDEITRVRAYTQRCIEAAIKTHDTIGRPLNVYCCVPPIFQSFTCTFRLTLASSIL